MDDGAPPPGLGRSRFKRRFNNQGGDMLIGDAMDLELAACLGVEGEQLEEDDGIKPYTPDERAAVATGLAAYVRAPSGTERHHFRAALTARNGPRNYLNTRCGPGSRREENAAAARCVRRKHMDSPVCPINSTPSSN